jgi:UDPglucose 6-dehydrogenase
MGEEMKLGVVGLGKLGMPVALALAHSGHDVMGYDVDPERMQKDRFPHRELGPAGEPSIEPLLRESSIRFGSLEDVVAHAEIVFVAVQTPHEPEYEGVTRLPDQRVDFDYTWLRAAVGSLSHAIERLREDRVVIVISTVLPGTVRRELLPLINNHVRLCYNPFFIAMGTTIRDFLDPEFVLLGVRDREATVKARELYATLHDRPLYETSIENAELIKVSYNTYITMKIAFANTLMEICHKIDGCDVDQVSGGLALGTQRLLSPAYLGGGMGDGGGCHPRDNIALSWLARELDLSYDWFEGIMLARERQTDWLADLVEEQHERGGFSHRRVGIYGRAFKAGTNLTVGSPAILLRNMLEERGFHVEMYDPHIDAGACKFAEPGVYVVATRHDEFADPTWEYPSGSVVIDPWRYVPQHPSYEVVHVGVGHAPYLEDVLTSQAAARRSRREPIRRAVLAED